MAKRKADVAYSIDCASLELDWRCNLNRKPTKLGPPINLLQEEERTLATNIAALVDYGLDFRLEDICSFIQYYLNKLGRQVPVFKQNLPDIIWSIMFLKRHIDIISNSHNIMRKRAIVSDNYFEQLKKTLDGVPPENMICFQEINLTDDMRFCNRDAERLSISIMFAITPTGRCLPPYVVYKGQESWNTGGPIHVLYNKSKSGWFDSEVFIDWFKQVVLPYIQSLPPAEPKILFGDMSYEVIDLCEQNNIRIVFYPPDADEFLHPFKVDCSIPLNIAWNRVIIEWKLDIGKNHSSIPKLCFPGSIIPKYCFPGLLLRLLTKMEDELPQLCKSSFKKCGIYPINTNIISYIKETLSNLSPSTSSNRPSTSGERPIIVPPGASVSSPSISCSHPSISGEFPIIVPPGASVTSPSISCSLPSTSRECPSNVAPVTMVSSLSTSGQRLNKYIKLVSDSSEEDYSSTSSSPSTSGEVHQKNVVNDSNDDDDDDY